MATSGEALREQVRSRYAAAATCVSLADVSVTFTHRVADGLQSAIVEAVKPLGGE